MKGRLIASVLSVSMIAGLLAGCGGGNTSQTAGGGYFGHGLSHNRKHS